jgi:S-DNA-T family DNA segregation ATPase FtsK/SpoIIIE
MPRRERRTSMKSEQQLPLVGGIVIVAASLLVLVSLFTDRAGVVGGFLHRVLLTLFGCGAYVLPLLTLGTAIAAIAGKHVHSRMAIGLLVEFLSLLTALQLLFPAHEAYKSGGGAIGQMLATAMVGMFGGIGGWIMIVAAAFIGIVLVEERFLTSLAVALRAVLTVRGREQVAAGGRSTDVASVALGGPEPRAEQRPPSDLPNVNLASAAPWVKTASEAPAAGVQLEIPQTVGSYQMPPITLLKKPVKLKNYRLEKDIAENVRLLEETLANFGIGAKVTEVSRGPAITRYEIHPAPGTKVSRIVSLADDIALSLAATDVRIEAPIPGKAAIGIEVPNKEITPVYLREVIDTAAFSRATSPLTIALGKDVSGAPVYADLAKMPHLLIAGATGSGKSVCINALISSILFKATPAQVKLLLVDPKMVELTGYNGVPHLIAPVVTDVKKTAGVLNWAVTEMENRYSLFASAGVRDIARYNEGRPSSSALPYIVIVIDELADLMMVSPAEVEEAICRLAQMARAAGLHLVVATQRPSVDVITGLIKANIPSRLSFAVSSQTDSRTILDMNGAEKLLGRGDMLFFPVGASKPQRVQGAFISDGEVEELVEFWRQQGEPDYQEAIMSVQPKSRETVTQDDEDELFGKALELVVEAGQASASYLQRRLRIGYTRAARIIDQLAEKGYVGPSEGSKPRPVLISKERYHHLLNEDSGM